MAGATTQGSAPEAVQTARRSVIAVLDQGLTQLRLVRQAREARGGSLTPEEVDTILELAADTLYALRDAHIAIGALYCELHR